MKRYVVLAASVLMQACFGGIYAWSTFVPALRSSYGLTAAQAGLVFGLTIAVFTLAMVFAGRLLEFRGPRLVAAIGGALFAAGYLLAAHSRGSFPLLLLGLGVVAGAGIGFGYVCPLATCVRWFPRQKGFITGLAVAGFGGGAIFLSEAVELLVHRGTDVLHVFRLVGLVYGAAIIAAAMFLLPPARAIAHGEHPHVPLRRLLPRKEFWSLAVGMFAGTFGGLLVVGNLAPIGLDLGLDSQRATVAVVLFAVANASGRILWGLIFDRIGRHAVALSLVCLVAGTLVLLAANAFPTLLAGAALVGFAFGGCFVLYAAEVAAAYGHERVAAVYPFVFLAYGLAGITAPAAGGWAFDAFRTYTPALLVAAAVAAAGALLNWRLAPRNP